MSSFRPNVIIFTVFCLIVPFSAFTQECSIKSEVKTVPLLELYTSEGFSSCPPADKWLSALRIHQAKVTPLAFHVDYWDYIGWKDPFAKAAYSARQRKQAALTGVGFVYTPQFTLNGQDYRNWRDSQLSKEIARNENIVAPVQLQLQAKMDAAGQWQIQADVEALNVELMPFAEVYIAIYENALVSQVNAGENNGSVLKHDYVVRDLLGAYPMQQHTHFSKNITVPLSRNHKKVGAVLFVQDQRNGRILQSLQLPFCG